MDIMTLPLVASLAAFIGALVGIFLIMTLIMFAAFYVYTSWALMTIGKKLNIGPTYLAWIPVAKWFYIPMLAGYEWYYGFLWLLVLIPFLGIAVLLGLTIWWWWKISEARGKEAWLGILMAITPINIIFLGIIAWTEPTKKKQIATRSKKSKKKAKRKK